LLPAVGCAQIAGYLRAAAKMPVEKLAGVRGAGSGADHRSRGSRAGQAAGLCLAVAVGDYQVLVGRQYRPPLGFRCASRCPVVAQGGDFRESVRQCIQMREDIARMA
jgi:hypothetical protein